MTRSKHPKTRPGAHSRIDLEADPGIGASKGAFMTGEDPRRIEGASTSKATWRTTPPARAASIRRGRAGRTSETTEEAPPAPFRDGATVIPGGPNGPGPESHDR
ncbi:hypothetical protein [Microvirga thermotolerans]|uniref:hypothetical protein n=1 Tax=Microvirga thermotolerans TaxID=2651334 RepID=UPI003CCD5368